MKKLYLTGIKPTGEIHLGNYIGAIKPAVELLKNNSEDNFLYFIADYHALNFLEGDERRHLKDYTHKILASYIACGLDPEKVSFYKQSSIPQIFELQCILNNFTPKSIMNSSHAYKNKIEGNNSNMRDVDSGVNMGLYNYPILMAADILIFNATHVPVGEDQVQHIEIARDIARRFNHNVKNTFKEPEAVYKEFMSKLIGIDGKKMSKSYNNTIPLFSKENELLKRIKQIETDSKGISETKTLDNNIMQIYRYFGNKEEIENMMDEFHTGISYGEAKEMLFEVINKELKPMRDKFFELMAQPDYLDKVLEEGADRVKPFAQRGLDKVKKSLKI